MPGSIFGNRVLRKEDPKFLTTGGVYVDDLRRAAARRRRCTSPTSARRSPTARSPAIDTGAAAASPGVLAVYTAADLGLEPVPAAFNPMVARPLLAPREGPLRRRAGRRRRQRSGATRARTPPSRSIVDYDAARRRWSTSRPRWPAARCCTRTPAATSVFDSTALGMPGITGDAFFEGCEVGRHAAARQPARRPVPPRGARLGRGVGRRPAPPVAVARSTPRARTRVDHGGQRRRAGPGPHHHPRRRRRLRRQDRRATRRRSCSAALAKELGRPVRWRETRSESMMALGHGRAQVQRITIGGTRDGKVTAYRLHVIQDCGAFAEMGTVLAAVHDPADVVGRLRHPEHRVPHHLGRHQHHAGRGLPGRRAARRPPRRSSGPWTCSRPRSAWTRSTCAGRT